MIRTIIPAFAVAAALTGCTSSNVLEPSALTSPEPAPVETLQQQLASVDAARASAMQVPKLRIEPAIGAPSTASVPLNERLAARAGEMGIPVAGGSSDGLVLKGYFSAITEGPQTTVIYVWDVIDGSGQRLHRIQGQERLAAEGAEGWNGVDDQAMQRIADSTIDQYAAWLLSRSG